MIVGQEFRDFCAPIDSKGRGRRLSTLFSLLGVYANSEQVLLAYTPSQSRAQREDVLAAIAAKEAEVAPLAQGSSALSRYRGNMANTGKSGLDRLKGLTNTHAPGRKRKDATDENPKGSKDGPRP